MKHGAGGRGNYREEDVGRVLPKGIAARACYHACGFADDEKLTMFGNPCQKRILENSNEGGLDV